MSILALMAGASSTPAPTPKTPAVTPSTSSPLSSTTKAVEAKTQTLVKFLDYVFGTPQGRILAGVVFVAAFLLFSPGLRKVLAPFWRLVSGGLVFVEPSPWNSTFLNRAPDRPQNRPNFRGESYPHTRWGKLPGYVRMFVRWGVTLYVIVLTAWTVPVLVLTCVIGLFLMARQVDRLLNGWAHGRVTSLFAPAAAAVLGYGNQDPTTWIAVPKWKIVRHQVPAHPRLLQVAGRWPRVEKFLASLWVPVVKVPLDADDARVLVKLDVTEVNSQAIDAVKALSVRLPEGPWKAEHAQAKLQIEFRHESGPPSHVEYSSDVFDRYQAWEVPIGQEAGGAWVTLPMKDLTPHGVMSATTGWCKTTTANVLVAHTAGNGGKVYINDPKRIGYTGAFGGIPNIIIRVTAEGWAVSVDEFLTEMERRYKLIEQFPEIKEHPELYFQPWFMVTDERGSYTQAVKTWWKRTGGEDGKPGKGVPEPFEQEKVILWQARAALMFVTDLCQQANLSVFLDSDGRDQRMWRIASGPQTRSSWMMLFPGLAKMSAKMKKGRAVLGIGIDSVKPIQLASTTDQRAREFALCGAAVMEQENVLRARRLADLLAAQGVPVPEDRHGSPGENAPRVPGQRDRTGTPDSERPTPDYVDLSAYLDRDDEFADDDGNRYLRVVRNDRDNAFGDAENVLVLDDLDEEEDDEEELIVGVKNAVEFLNMPSSDAFIAARKRRPIPGETTVGRQPAWPPLELREWRAQSRAGGA